LPIPVSAACIITTCWNQSPRKFLRSTPHKIPHSRREAKNRIAGSY
jgi:hypothetical protein